LKAIFVGDSEFAPHQSCKSLGNAPDLDSVMVGDRRRFWVDFGGESLP
jgi:hypothetical protein